MIRVYIAAAAAAAVLAGLAWGGRALHQAGAQGVRVEWAASSARLTEDARLLAAERETKIEEVDHVAIAETRVFRAAAVSAAIAGGGLRLRTEAVAARCDSGPAGDSETTPSPGALLADMQRRLEEAGRLYSATADERGIAGTACETAYDSVKGQPASNADTKKLTLKIEK